MKKFLPYLFAAVTFASCGLSKEEKKASTKEFYENAVSQAAIKDNCDGSFKNRFATALQESELVVLSTDHRTEHGSEHQLDNVDAKFQNNIKEVHAVLVKNKKDTIVDLFYKMHDISYEADCGGCDKKPWYDKTKYEHTTVTLINNSTSIGNQEFDLRNVYEEPNGNQPIITTRSASVDYYNPYARSHSHGLK